MPTWIHTVAAAAETGWSVQMVVPTLTRCCTHPGDVAAAGVITSPGRPTGIELCTWSSPSNSQRIPKLMRSTRRAAGSGYGHGSGTLASTVPAATARR